jgi:hypothetical protein
MVFEFYFRTVEGQRLLENVERIRFDRAADQDVISTDLISEKLKPRENLFATDIPTGAPRHFIGCPTRSCSSPSRPTAVPPNLARPRRVVPPMRSRHLNRVR